LVGGKVQSGCTLFFIGKGPQRVDNVHKETLLRVAWGEGASGCEGILRGPGAAKAEKKKEWGNKDPKRLIYSRGQGPRL